MKKAREKRFISIKQKILLALVSVFAVLLAISMFFIYKNLQRVTYQNFEENVHSLARTISMSIEALPVAQWKEIVTEKDFSAEGYQQLRHEVQKYITNFQSIEYIHITLKGDENKLYWLVNTDNAINYTKEAGTVALIPEEDTEFWAEEGSYFFSDKTHNTFVVLTAVYDKQSNVVGDIGIGVATKSITAQMLSSMQVYLLSFVGIFATIIGAFIFLMYRIVINPLEKVTSAVKELDYAVEKFEIREVTLQGNDEVYLLYSSIKVMLSELRKYIDFSKKASWDAEHDAMTKLYNKRKFHNMYDEYSKSSSIGVISFDVNFLKRTNDIEGHAAGDSLIQKAAKSIRSITGEKVHGYRMGGDEFLVICCDMAKGEFLEFVEKWKKNLGILNQAGVVCSMAHGCAYASGKFNVDELLKLADFDMYNDKNEMKSIAN